VASPRDERAALITEPATGCHNARVRGCGIAVVTAVLGICGAFLMFVGVIAIRIAHAWFIDAFGVAFVVGAIACFATAIAVAGGNRRT